MFDVGGYTLSPVKVVWNRMGHQIGSRRDDRPRDRPNAAARDACLVRGLDADGGADIGGAAQQQMAARWRQSARSAEAATTHHRAVRLRPLTQQMDSTAASTCGNRRPGNRRVWRQLQPPAPPSTYCRRILGHRRNLIVVWTQTLRVAGSSLDSLMTTLNPNHVGTTIWSLASEFLPERPKQRLGRLAMNDLVVLGVDPLPKHCATALALSSRPGWIAREQAGCGLVKSNVAICYGIDLNR